MQSTSSPLLPEYFHRIALAVCCACYAPTSCFACAVHALLYISWHALLCFACFALDLMPCYSFQLCASAGLVKGKAIVCVSDFNSYTCYSTHIVHVIQACCLQQCKRLEKKRARQASDCASDTDKAAPAAGEPGYLSKLRRSISSLRSSRR